ncbi:MAG: metallophosphoesterase [Kiritimatiellae bacterium]|nr:metallophosphoesterase [Kiritimatiellia bacterium]
MNMDRRAFLLSAGAFGLFSAVRLHGEELSGQNPLVRFGMMTDVHYADKDPDPAPVGVVGRRFYRESLRKLDAAMAVFNARKVDFAIELGDYKDQCADKPATLVHLETVERHFAAFAGPRYHVLGNHDFDCLTEADFFARVTNDGRPMTRGYYSFAKNGVTFIVLDACYDSRMRHYSENNPWDDANVPPAELAWLAAELAAARGPVVVFCHQRLDPSSEPRHLVRNAAAVREILEKSGKVKTVFTGHQHLGSFMVLNGISYYSLIAMVCDSGKAANSFAEAAIYPDGSFTVTGWCNAVSYNCGKGVLA